MSLLIDILKLLADGKALPSKHKDYRLNGNYKGCRECHITLDWILIYEISNGDLILHLTRIRTHSDLFSL